MRPAVTVGQLGSDAFLLDTLTSPLYPAYRQMEGCSAMEGAFRFPRVSARFVEPEATGVRTHGLNTDRALPVSRPAQSP